MRTFLSLGSNMGDRRSQLSDAIASLPGLVAVSPVYESDPVGGPDQDSYLNVIAELDVDLDPWVLLGICHRLEAAANRVRDVRWGPRTLDVDIIWMDGVEMNDERLTIPHPRWRERRFVLVPLRDLASDLVTAADIEVADGRVWPVEALK